jgi:glucose/mannose transport system permease protein
MSSQLVDRVLTKDIKMNAKRKLNGTEKFFLIFKYVGLIILTIIAALPIYIMVINSVKGITGVTQSAAFVPPTSLNFAAWGPIWEQMKVPMGRTAFFVVQSSIISAIIGSINGYVFAKWKFRGSTFIFTTFLFGMFIPYQAIMIPLTQFNQWAHLGGSIYVLVVAHVIYGIPICTLIFRNYYAGIPNELIEAARVDGAGMVRIFRTIILPLSIPGFVVVLIWQFTSAWNDFLFAIFLTGGSPDLSVATTALNFITGSGNQVYYGNNMTASLIVSIPTLLVYMFLGRYFLRGLLSGSLKG